MPILIARYRSDPAGEIRDGFVQRWATSGQPKARGLSFSLKLPYSFSSAPGEQPNTVHRWHEWGGLGRFSIAVQVRDLPGLATKEEVDLTFSAPEMRSMDADVRKEGGRVVNYGRLRHEGFEGGWQTQILNTDRAGIAFRAISLQYMLFSGRKALLLGCTHIGDQGTPDQILEATSKHYELLCRLVLNSLVVDKASFR